MKQMRFFDFSKELVKSSVQMGEIAENRSAKHCSSVNDGLSAV